MFPLFTPRVGVEVAKPELKAVQGVLPKIEELDAILAKNMGTLDEIIGAGGATAIDLTSAYTANVISEYYVGSSPPGLSIGTNTCCHGSRVQVTSYRVYFMEQNAAYSPDDFNRRYGHYPGIYVREHGSTVKVHTMRGPAKYGLGRAGGICGWDSLRDAFAFGLASLRHNFQAMIGVFESRPSLPCRDSWTLPNLVHHERVREIEEKYGCEIVEPPFAVPPASYTYSFALPTPLMVLAIGTKCPRETRAHLEFWGEDKRDMVEPMAVTFPEGDSETVVTVRAEPPGLLQRGYFNINPETDMTVGYVEVIHPPI